MPFIDMNVLPAPGQNNPATNTDPAAAGRLAATGVGARPAPAWETILTAVFARAGEIESAEWALDQAKAACDEQIVAAFSAGVPEAKIAEAAGVCASTVAEVVRGLAPAEG